MDEPQTTAQARRAIEIELEELERSHEREDRLEALGRQAVGPELEGWIYPQAGDDPYEGLAEQLFQVRGMLLRLLPAYHHAFLKDQVWLSGNIARLMQVSASLARALKQGAPKIITVPAVDVSDSKTVRGGRKAKGAQD